MPLTPEQKRYLELAGFMIYLCNDYEALKNRYHNRFWLMEMPSAQLYPYLSDLQTEFFYSFDEALEYIVRKKMEET